MCRLESSIRDQLDKLNPGELLCRCGAVFCIGFGHLEECVCRVYAS